MQVTATKCDNCDILTFANQDDLCDSCQSLYDKMVRNNLPTIIEEVTTEWRELELAKARIFRLVEHIYRDKLEEFERHFGTESRELLEKAIGEQV